MLTDLHEFGYLSSKQAAALAGLASALRKSGNWRGRERL
ncbi:hypothetical protein KO516_00505 [Citreicella sp. C3M06]|nr:hypothetical protein [Citreicella sp. C3M06]